MDLSFWSVELHLERDPSFLSLPNRYSEFSYEPGYEFEDEEREISFQAGTELTSLHWAATVGSLESLRQLLANKQDIESRDENELTPLHSAVIGNHAECILFLLGKGANINAKDRNEETALHKATIQDNKEILKLLIEKGADLKAKDAVGATALHRAAELGRVDFIVALTEKGADLNAEDEEGLTALHYSSMNGYHSTTKKLLELGIDAGKQDETGCTALHQASFHGHFECVKLLANSNNCNLKDKLGETPLHKACHNGHTEIATHLLDTGSSVNAQDKDGETPLHKAASKNHTDCIKLLRDRHADLDKQTYAGLTPLELAATLKTSEALSVLLSSGAEFSPNALFLACSSNSIPALELLLNKSTQFELDVHDITNADGLGLLHVAANFKAKPAVRFLVSQRGFNVNKKDSNEKTPLFYALQNADQEVADLLLSLGAELERGRFGTKKALVEVDHTAQTSARMRKQSKRIVERLSVDPELLKKPEVETTGGKASLSTEQQAEVVKAITLFNTKPDKGIKLLTDNGLIGPSADDVAQFLSDTEGLNKTKIGEYLGDGDEFNVTVLRSFVHRLDFSGADFDAALRRFLARFRLPGEAQKIDRMMEAFAQKFYEQNPGSVFANSDAAYVLAFSVIMLNTDAHNPNIKNKMVKADFIKNNRGINNGEDMPQDFMENVYDKIISEEIVMEKDDSKINPFSGSTKKGWLTKQGGRIKTWKRRWFILAGGCLYYFKNSTDAEPCGIIPLENLLIEKSAKPKHGKYSFVLRSKNEENIKAVKLQEGAKMGNHQFYTLAAASQKEMDDWISSINNNILSNPFYELLEKTKRAKIEKKKLERQALSTGGSLNNLNKESKRIDIKVDESGIAMVSSLIIRELEFKEEVCQTDFHKFYKSLVRGKETINVEMKLSNEAIRNEEFLPEVNNWRLAFKHPNIMELIGVAEDTTLLIYEFYQPKILYRLLQNRSWAENEFSFKTRMKIAGDIAHGLKYLTTLNPPFYHKTLFSGCIMILDLTENAKVNAKIGKFDWTHNLPSNAKQSFWIAPELYATNKGHNEKTDVYSFGIILWELGHLKTPYEDVELDVAAIKEKIEKENFRPAIGEGLPSEISDLMKTCWDPNQDERASLTSILKTLSKFTLDPNAPSDNLDVSSKGGEADSAVVFESVIIGFSKKVAPNPRSSVNCLALVDEQIWAGCGDGNVHCFHFKNGQLFGFFKAHEKAVNCLLKEKNTIWSCSDDNSVQVWDIKRQKSLKKLSLHAAPVLSLAIVDNYMWSGDAVGTVIIWNIKSLQKINSINLNTPIRVMSHVAPHVWIGTNSQISIVPALSVNMNPIKKECGKTTSLVHVGSEVWACVDSRVLVWNCQTMMVTHTIDTSEELLSMVKFSNETVCCGGTSSLFIMDAQIKKCIQKVDGYQENIKCLSPAGVKNFWSGSEDNFLICWSTKLKKQQGAPVMFSTV